MRKFSFCFFVAVLSFGMFTACDNNSDDDGAETGYGDMTAIINDYVDKTVLPTYKDMKDRAWALYDAVAELSEDGGLTDENIAAACEAWRATRVPWEESESFLFGPAELQNLDPLLDSWPLDKTGIDQVLAGGNYDPEALGSSVRGFHTVEYLLFENGEERQATGISENHLEYLTVVTEILRNDCIKLWSSWAGADALAGKDAEAMEEIEFDPISPGWGDQFKNAGKAGSMYLSQDEAIDAIVEGCEDISDEVGAQKIGAPNDLAVAGNGDKAVLEVESWYSWNSIDDYANNILSIENSYMGGRNKSNRGASLSDYVKSRDEAMDTEIRAAIATAYTAIKNGMKQPFRNNLIGDEVDAAMEACADLTLTLGKIKSLKK
jgi:uncharacterized iron-regulated protein